MNEIAHYNKFSPSFPAMFPPFGNQMENIPTMFFTSSSERTHYGRLATLDVLHSPEPISAPGLSTGVSEPTFSKAAFFFRKKQQINSRKHIFKL